MTPSNLQMTKTTLTKSEFNELLKEFYNVKTYNDFGVEEYRVYTSNGEWIGAVDLNTKEIWVSKTIT